MATTDLSGSTAASSLALVRGFMADMAFVEATAIVAVTDTAAAMDIVAA
jgi:hypothetical protein